VGSGFIVDRSGLIATNRHVVEDGIAVFVYTQDGVRYQADIVGMTTKADIALLRIHAGKDLPAVTFADSDKVRVGDSVIAIGSPYGFNNSVTAGVVSAVNRDIQDGPFDDFIQTDAAINHGNSGGPLFNLSGQLIGMNTALFGPTTASSGLGFSIPGNDLKFVVGRLAETGKIHAGMLPIRAQNVTWMLEQATGAQTLKGALVISVGPGAEGKIQPGDVVTAFDGQPVQDPRDLARKAVQTPVGTDVALEVFRDGKTRTVHFTIQPWPEAKLPPPLDLSHWQLGLHLAPAPKGGSAGGAGGMIITAVDPTGTAAASGLQKGDVVLRVQQEVASSPDQTLHVLEAMHAKQQPFAMALIRRGDTTAWVSVVVP
jgi:serine protease Do